MVVVVVLAMEVVGEGMRLLGGHFVAGISRFIDPRNILW
jgi:hypothetical protein